MKRNYYILFIKAIHFNFNLGKKINFILEQYFKYFYYIYTALQFKLQLIYIVICLEYC